MRWLYHVTTTDSVARSAEEGFVHCSFQPDVRETIRLHYTNISPRDLRVIRIDPRRVEDVRIEGVRAMPHVYGTISDDAIVETISIDAIDAALDEVRGTQFALVGFARMTLLDLVSVFDPLSRIASMGFDATSSVEIASATHEPWNACGARFEASRVRPPLDAFDVLVVAGGPETRTLENDPNVVTWLKTFPDNRIAASVCTGALLLGAAGRLRKKRATTHHESFHLLERYEANVVRGERVVRDGQLFTAGGVTSGLDLGLALASWLYGSATSERIAARMEYVRRSS